MVEDVALNRLVCAPLRGIGKTVSLDSFGDALYFAVNTGNEIMKCFEEINKNGKTVILITHDINIANRCKRVIHIEDGKIID